MVDFIQSSIHNPQSTTHHTSTHIELEAAYKHSSLLNMQILHFNITGSVNTLLPRKSYADKELQSQKQRPNELKFLRNLTPSLVAAILALSPALITPPVVAAETIDVQKGATLFNRSCIGCHDAGGNIIQPGATLFLKDLQRNGVETEDEIYQITYYGKGRMPGFGEKCTPRGQCTFGPRLQDDEIKLLAEFVKLQAVEGWSKIE